MAESDRRDTPVNSRSRHLECDCISQKRAHVFTKFCTRLHGCDSGAPLSEVTKSFPQIPQHHLLEVCPQGVEVKSDDH